MLPEGKPAVCMLYYVSLGFVVQSRHVLCSSAQKGEGRFQAIELVAGQWQTCSTFLSAGYYGVTFEDIVLTFTVIHALSTLARKREGPALSHPTGLC